MSCPDWSRLAAARADGVEPAGWRAAVVHFDTCSRCRAEALRHDPTLVFRRLPAPPVEATDAAEMRQRVALARRVVRAPRRRSGRSRRWSGAAALLAAALVSALPGHGPQADATSAPWWGAGRAAGPLAAVVEQQPLFEETDRPYDQVMQYTDEDLSLVMVFDAGLDV